MTKLYLIRHGQTGDNYSQRFCGWTDAPLNELGKSQAQSLTSAFEDIEIDIIYTSDLKRAKETASYIKKGKGFFVKELDSLRELNFGVAEGLIVEEIKEKHPQVYEDMEKDYIGAKFPEGESLEDMHNRVSQAIDDILVKHDGQSIALVAHSGVIRSIISHLITGDIKHHWSFKIDNCSITVIEKDKNFAFLTKLNDTWHLKDINL